MAKKIFVLCLALIFVFQGAALAKKNKLPEIPLEKRIKILVKTFDVTTFHELDTAEILCGMLEENLAATNVFNLRYRISADEKFSDMKTLGEKRSASDVGDLLIFNPIEENAQKVEPLTEDELNTCKEIGVDYVVKCTVLGLGTTKKLHDTFGLGNGIGIGIGSHVGVGIYSGVSTSFRRTYYSTAVNMQFIKADTNTVLFQRNLVGQAARHKKPRKGYDDASDEAYLKSIKDAADFIAKRVTLYAENHLIEKPKDDKKAAKK